MSPEITLYDSNAAIVQFLTGHAVAIYIGIKTIKLISKITPWTWDDDIAPFLSNIVDTVRNQRGGVITGQEDKD